MTTRDIELKLRKVLRCCESTRCRIDVIDGELVIINERLDNVELDITDLQTQVEDHETRITTLEGAGGGGTSITVVSNYAALPAPATVPNEFYYVEADQGTWWLPGSWGGNYYPQGLYYSNGVSWETRTSAWNALQATVDAGLNNDQFVTALTLANATTVSHPGHTHVITDISSFTKAQLDTAVSDGNVLYVGDVTTNATHTGEVTGATVLTVDKTAITNKTLVTAASTDHVLIADASDSDNLKKVLVSDFGSSFDYPQVLFSQIFS